MVQCNHEFPDAFVSEAVGAPSDPEGDLKGSVVTADILSYVCDGLVGGPSPSELTPHDL